MEELRLSREKDFFANMTEEEIVILAQQKHNGAAEEYLLQKYKNFVRKKTNRYYIVGAEREDIIQEGMIGLYKAIRDFRSDKNSSFKAFADLCVRRQIITAIKTATRQKHQALNTFISLNGPIYDDDSDRTYIDIIGAPGANPEEMVIGSEELKDIVKVLLDILSDLEWRVLMSYLDGKSYQEIAVELNRHIKSIDNALQRVKRKIEKHINSHVDFLDLHKLYNGLLEMNPDERLQNKSFPGKYHAGSID